MILELRVSGSPLEKLGEATYEELFVTALKNHGMLSIGLYRLISCIIMMAKQIGPKYPHLILFFIPDPMTL